MILNTNLLPHFRKEATVTLIARNLTALCLIKRSIVDSRPVRTVYQNIEKGQKLPDYLRTIEQL